MWGRASAPNVLMISSDGPFEWPLSLLFACSPVRRNKFLPRL